MFKSKRLIVMVVVLVFGIVALNASAGKKKKPDPIMTKLDEIIGILEEKLEPVPCEPVPCEPVPCEEVPCDPVPCDPVPCEPIEVVGVPKTGQTTTYATGDDGYWQKGVDWPVPRFTDNANGTVTDNLTGLIWLKNAGCLSQGTWPAAITAANTLKNGDCGLSDGSVEGDWRIPNVRELQSLIDFSNNNLALPSGHPFTGVVNLAYWTSTKYAAYDGQVWYVDLNYGFMFNTIIGAPVYAWPVKGGY